MLKPDSKLRGCALNQGCYEELMFTWKNPGQLYIYEKGDSNEVPSEEDKLKKKGHWSRQEITFYDMNDLLWYKDIILESGCKNYTITPVD